MIYVVGCEINQIWRWADERHISPGEIKGTNGKFRPLPLTHPSVFRGWRFRDGDALIYLEEFKLCLNSDAAYEHLRMLEHYALFERIQLHTKYHHTIPRCTADWDIEYIGAEMENDPWATDNRRDEPLAKRDILSEEMLEFSIVKEKDEWQPIPKSAPEEF